MRWKHYDVDCPETRNYGVFGILAGARSDIPPLFPPRGVPEDATWKTRKEYLDDCGDFHTASWLSTTEFRECLDAVDEIIRDRRQDAYQSDWLSDYEFIYRLMKDSEDEGEPARIIFWFDN